MRARATWILAAVAIAAAPAAAQSPAQLSFVEEQVERSAPAAPWQQAVEGSGFEFGELLRVTDQGLARLRFPWMAVTAGPSTTLAFPDAGILELRLDEGRVALDAPNREILKLTTPAAEVRGIGRVVVRVEDGKTLVMAHDGSFSVSGAGRSVLLEAGQGTVVPDGSGPAQPTALPAAPRQLSPGEDPIYVETGESTRVSWNGDGRSHWVELLAVGSDEVLLQRDAGPQATSLQIPWPGAFRWRVSSRDALGLEGLPSRDGLICVVER